MRFVDFGQVHVRVAPGFVVKVRRDGADARNGATEKRQLRRRGVVIGAVHGDQLELAVDRDGDADAEEPLRQEHAVRLLPRGEGRDVGVRCVGPVHGPEHGIMTLPVAAAMAMGSAAIRASLADFGTAPPCRRFL